MTIPENVESTNQRDAIEALRDRMLLWYSEHQRDLPWRKTRDPYSLVVAEFMLQQTGVDRVSSRWTSFLERFPTWQSLASASPGDVIREWQGLGYNRRALNLHRLASIVVREFDGTLPSDRETLLRLPGIGPYTAGAIQSFVFDQNVASIDVNLIRTIGRVVLGADRAHIGLIEPIARRALPRGHSAAWNQALMDFAAKQCTPRRPKCLMCPLLDVCAFVRDAATDQPESNTTVSSMGHLFSRENTLNGIGYTERTGRALKQVAERPVPYAGSNRFFRGRIVDRLRALAPGETCTTAEMRSAVSEHAGAGQIDFDRLLGDLTKEGLIVSDEKGHLQLP